MNHPQGTLNIHARLHHDVRTTHPALNKCQTAVDPLKVKCVGFRSLI